MNKTELQAEVTRLTEMSTKLAEMLNTKIDECTILSSEVASLRETIKECGMHNTPTMVQLTTDFGPDIVFATVMVTTGKTFVRTEVVSWSMDGREQPLEALSEEGYRTLRRLAREKVELWESL